MDIFLVLDEELFFDNLEIAYDLILKNIKELEKTDKVMEL